MAVKLFGQDISGIKAFGSDVEKVMAYGEEVWSASLPDYLCFTALESGTFTLTVPTYVTTAYLSYIEWSKDGKTWTRWTNDGAGATINVEVLADDKVYWRGIGQCMTGLNDGTDRASIFSSTARFNASGHLMSLLKGKAFTDDALVNYATSGIRNVTFANLFRSCTTLVNAKDMVIPSFSSYYTYMFYYTFYGCTNLVSSPALPSTELANSCYSGMFRACSSLATPQELLATTLVVACYRNMLQGTSVDYIKCMATDISAANCLTDWVSNVSSTGTFIQAEGVSWPTGASGIPSGWVTIEKRTMPTGYKQVEYVTNEIDSESYSNINTGIVLDPSQDTFEFAVHPKLDADGYLVGYTYGEMPFANSSTPGASGSKVGRFYTLYRKNSSTDMMQFFANIQTSSGSYVAANNKITDNPQVFKIVCDSTSFTFYLNGTQVGSRTNITIDTSDMGTEEAKIFGYNSKNYCWRQPFYYLWWKRAGTLIADYVPCIRESDNVVGFYDFVSSTFKTASKASSLTAGPEI